MSNQEPSSNSITPLRTFKDHVQLLTLEVKHIKSKNSEYEFQSKSTLYSLTECQELPA